ncbi:MAG: ABC transporter permease, partial [Candidatus Competibacterales bacterium]
PPAPPPPAAPRPPPRPGPPPPPGGGGGRRNAGGAYLDGKLRTIAMLKAVGAPSQTVFQVYLLQVLALSLVGIALGLVVGAVAPPVASLILADLLPFDLPLAFYPGALGLAAAFGLITALTFAIGPLARTQGVPAAAVFRSQITGIAATLPRRYAAMIGLAGLLLATLAVLSADNPRFALWFVAGALVALAVFQGAARMVMGLARRLSHGGVASRPGLRLALANLHRPGSPTPQVVLSLGLGLTVLTTIALIEGNLARQVQNDIPAKAPAFFFVDIQSAQRDPFIDAVTAIAGTGALETVPYLRGRILQVRGVDAEAALVDPEYRWLIRGDRGVSYASSPPDNGQITAGSWWEPDYRGPPLLSVHEDVARAFDLQVGDTMTINVLGRALQATVANIRALEWRSMQINFTLVFSPEPLRYAPHGYLATLEATEEAEAAVARTVTQGFANVTAVRVRDALETVNEILRDIGAAIRSVAAITLVAGTLVLAGAIAAGHRQRVYDSVVLKVLGATRRRVVGIFLLEYGLLGLITATISAGVGTLAAYCVVVWVLQAPWTWLPEVMVTTVVLCSVITVSMGLVGTWRALGQKAAPLLRND